MFVKYLKVIILIILFSIIIPRQTIFSQNLKVGKNFQLKELSKPMYNLNDSPRRTVNSQCELNMEETYCKNI